MVASVFNALAVYCFKMELPSRADLKWVIARSLLEDLHWYHGFLKWRKVQVETVLLNVLNVYVKYILRNRFDVLTCFDRYETRPSE